MVATIRHKRGDTLAWDAIFWTDSTKTSRVDLTGWTVSARARHESGISKDFTVIMNDAVNGEIGLSIPASLSAEMPPGTWKIDIQRVDAGGVTRSTDTFAIDVVEDVTP